MSQTPPPLEDFEPPPPVGRRRRKKSAPGVAVASLICGIFGLCCFPSGIFALILGIVGLSKTGSPETSNGRGLAIAGTVLGGLSILMAPLMIAILLPALGASRRTARLMQNSTQLRGIHMGMTTFANSNKNNFPGLDSKGLILIDSDQNTGNSGDGSTPQARMWILLRGSYFTPEYAISPAETDASITAYSGSGAVKPTDYSYALLDFETGSMTGNAYTVNPNSAGRVSEWKSTMSSRAVVICDRNTGTNNDASVTSVFTGTPGEWRGGVVWNDNRVAVENSHVVADTKYASGTLNPQDNLYRDETAGNDALLSHD
ncbi:MAG: DUF4190 domain-containing protein [Phycisphaeraceae bacterium]